MQIALGRGRVTAVVEECGFLPYVNHTEVRPIVVLQHGHDTEYLVSLAELEQFRDDLQSMSNETVSGLLGGEPHYHYITVDEDAALKIGNSIAQDASASELNDVLDAHEDIIEKKTCVVCDEPFHRNDEGKHANIGMFYGSEPIHTSCCSTLAERLGEVWEHTDELIGHMA